MNSTVTNDFKTSIKKWVQIDNKQKDIRILSSNLKKEKDKLQMFITEYMENNNMQKKNILFNDGKLQYSTTKSTKPISKKYIIDKLTPYFNSKDKATEIADLLYENREITYKSTIKRLKSKNK